MIRAMIWEVDNLTLRTKGPIKKGKTVWILWYVRRTLEKFQSGECVLGIREKKVYISWYLDSPDIACYNWLNLQEFSGRNYQQ